MANDEKNEPPKSTTGMPPAVPAPAKAAKKPEPEPEAPKAPAAAETSSKPFVPAWRVGRG